MKVKIIIVSIMICFMTASYLYSLDTSSAEELSEFSEISGDNFSSLSSVPDRAEIRISREWTELIPAIKFDVRFFNEGNSIIANLISQNIKIVIDTGRNNQNNEFTIDYYGNTQSFYNDILIQKDDIDLDNGIITFEISGSRGITGELTIFSINDAALGSIQFEIPALPDDPDIREAGFEEISLPDIPNVISVPASPEEIEEHNYYFELVTRMNYEHFYHHGSIPSNSQSGSLFTRNRSYQNNNSSNNQQIMENLQFLNRRECNH